jgi:purine-binding chemotaxis protein CheW
MARRDIIPLLADEAPSLLRAVEEGLLALERGEELQRAAQSAFHALHTMRSGAAVAGLDPMEKLAGRMEQALRLLAGGEMTPRQHITDALLQAADVLAAMFARLDELEHVEVGGALRALDAALGAELPPEDMARLRRREVRGPGAGAPLWRVSQWLLEQKLATEGVFRLTIASQTQANGEALYTRLGELLTLGEVLACAEDDDGALAIAYASPLEADLLGEALSLPQECITPLSAADLGLEPGETGLRQSAPAHEPAESSPPPPPPPAPEPLVGKNPAQAAPSEPSRDAPAGQAPPALGQYLVFHLGPEIYGVDISMVREIITLPPVTALPLTPDHVLGVINLRGAVVPVFDLRRKLQLPLEGGGEPVVVVLRLGSKLQGAVVDAVEEVIAVGEDEVQEAPEMSGQVRREHLRGLVHRQGRMIILLDLERLLAQEPPYHAA